MKGFTVHDVSHLDALWEIADLIAGPDFRLNPAEAFVFGIGVLLHDAGMSVMSYSGGIDELLKTDVWQEQAQGFGVAGQELHSIPAGVKAALVTNVLRLLHAQQAESLATQTWSLGQKHFHIIEDDDLRNHYGPISGKVAHSHHWDSASLPVKFSSIFGSFGEMPAGWTVDAVKVATLLRCADAAHIDHRRAPRRLFAMSKPAGLSEVHWSFQSKLTKPYVIGDRLYYSSIDPFDVSLVDAWYLCFDTVQMVDRELADADENLRSRGSRFAVVGVKGAKSVGQFAEAVQTTGWKPVGVDVQVSDVPSLARTLGGEALYSSKLAPIRELIQNAADSIDARAQIDSAFSKDKGRIVVRVAEHEGQWRIDVEDNGLGMSERVLTRALLDFGKSFWRSELVKDEYPEMRSGFQSARGKFGIGFFSVFMWAEKVTVVSRKFTAALSDTMALEFLGGVSQRPILREAYPRERISDTVTRVSLAVSKDTADLVQGKAVKSKRKMLNDDFFHHYRFSPFGREEFIGKDPIGRITAALDIDVVVEFDGKTVLANNRKWASLDGRGFIEYFAHVCGEIDAEAGAPGVSEVVEGGLVVGKALLVPSYLEKGDSAILVHDKGITVTVQHRAGIFGVVEGVAVNAARDRAQISSLAKNEQWMAGQEESIFLSAPDPARQISAQKRLISFERFSASKILFVLNREMLSLTQVLDRIASSGEVEIRLVQDHNDSFEWKEAESLSIIVGVRVDPNMLFVLCDLSVGDIDERRVIELFAGGDQESVAGKIFAEIGRVLGVGHRVSVRYVDRDTYSKRQDISISVRRGESSQDLERGRMGRA